ncbi:MAG: hypothetical protein U5L01_12265 [Rheinheimera sp.]|nr:hypothetical protein [Rheinheimera sp.]
MNGSTNTDRTNYFSDSASEPMSGKSTVAGIRPHGLLVDAVTEQKFEVQRETVKNERGQRIDNRPYGRLSERANELLYPANHPYAWPVIGYMDDLNRANVNDVKAFFPTLVWPKQCHDHHRWRCQCRGSITAGTKIFRGNSERPCS